MAKRLSLVIALLALVPLAVREASAEVVRVEVASRTPWGKNLEKLQGKVYFEVDPATASNQSITDVALAPRNAKGRVEFSSDFVVIRPKDTTKARHTVFLEIPNRGLTQSDGLFFRARNNSFDLLDLDSVQLTDPFLFDQGFTIAWLGWQFDLGQGEIRMEAPAAKVNSVVRESIVVTRTGARLSRLSYCAADTDQPDAKLIVKSRIDEPGSVIPRGDWALAGPSGDNLAPDPCWVVTRNAFEANKIYELIYTGQNPTVAGLGEAAVRDFVAYLKYGGVESPLREHPETLARVIGYGYSQSARFLRDFVYRGFNADEHQRQAFDGLFIASAGAGRGSFDHRYAMPGQAGNSVLSDLRPVDLFPFTDGIEEDPVTGARDGILRLAGASHTVPKIFNTFSATEYWARVGSLAYTTVDGTKELPLDANSRLYFFDGTPHSFYPFPPIRRGFANLGNYNSPGWAFRALLLDLDEWITKGTKPPDSVYAHLGAELVTRDHVDFPKIPGVEFPSYMPHNWRLDYGPEFLSKGIISIEPPKVGEAYAVLVPQVDRDGNDIGGIALPAIAAPLGTFTGWNYQLPSMANLDYLAGLAGSFIPFSKAAADRKTNGDPRLSIAERYSERDDYLDKVRTVVRGLAKRRLLRIEDLDAIVAESQSRWDYLNRQ